MTLHDPTPDPFPALLDNLLAGHSLNETTAGALMDRVLTGELVPERLAALLAALRAKGPAVDELVGFATAMRNHAHRITPPDRAGTLVFDNCGTGGAPRKTFNISTAAAFVLAADGITVAKHGNRSVTRPSGSADALERAGLAMDLTPDQCKIALDRVGIAFLFAPTFHPAMRHAGPVRAALGIKTVFNLLGPLTNPAGATRQVLGVYAPDLVPLVAAALARLGCEDGFVLHGLDDDGEPGFDEATPCGPVLYVRVQDGQAGAVQTLDPLDLGLARCDPADLLPVAAEDAPQRLRDVLSGRLTGPGADTVALNVAFGLVAAGHAPELAAGLARARTLLASGDGNTKLDALLSATQP